MDNKIWESNVIWGILQYLLIIDTLNGIFIQYNIPFPISQIVKFFLLIIITLGLANYYRGLILIFATLIWCGIIYLFHSLLGSWEIYATYYHLLKFLICAMTYAYLRLDLRKDDRIIIRTERIISVNTLVILINIYISLVGLGTQSYGEATSKGYFYAGNEVSALYLTLIPCYLYFISKKYSVSSPQYITAIVLIIGSTLLLSTKTAIVGTLFLSLYVTSLAIHKRKNQIKFYLIIGIILTAISIYGIVFLSNLDIWQRVTYIYDKGGFEYVFFSDRDKYWQEEKHDILSAGSAAIILGLGEERTVEMDFFDTFLNYGILGIAIVYGFYLYLLIKSYRYGRKCTIGKIVFMSNLTLLVSSSFAGHMVFSGMAGPFIALINIIPIAIHKHNPRHNKSLKKHLVFSEGYR